jgi:hypothetical protein
VYTDIIKLNICIKTRSMYILKSVAFNASIKIITFHIRNIQNIKFLYSILYSIYVIKSFILQIASMKQITKLSAVKYNAI